MPGIPVVHRVPPERLHHRGCVERARQDAHVRRRRDPAGQALVDETHPVRAADEERQREKALRDEDDVRLHAPHRQLPCGGDVTGRALPVGQHHGHGREFVEGEAVADVVVVGRHHAHPSVREQIDVGQAGEVAMREDHPVHGTQGLRGSAENPPLMSSRRSPMPGARSRRATASAWPKTVMT